MKKIIFILLAFVNTTEINATNGSYFEQIATISEKHFGIRQRVPKGYIRDNLRKHLIVVLNCNREQAGNGKTHFCSAYYETAINRDCESKLLYPYFPMLTTNYASYPYSKEKKSFKEAMIQSLCDLQNAHFYGVILGEKRIPKASWGEHLIKRIGGKEAKKWGQADSVFITDIKLYNPFQTRYTHCICINMAKEGYVPLFLKLMLTDKGYAEKEKRIRHIRNCLSYINSPWKYDNAEVKKALGITI